MANMRNTPTNTNYMNSTNWQLVIPKAPLVTFFCQQVKVPDVTGAGAKQPTLHADAYHPGDHLTFDDLNVQFIVDEDAANWDEIFYWMMDYGMGVTHTPRRTRNEDLVCDIELHVLNNNGFATKRYVFVDAFPIFLQGLTPLETTADSVQNIFTNATFRYTYFYPERLNINASPCAE